MHGDGDVCIACDMAGKACEPLGSRVPHQRSPQDSAHEESKESDLEGADVEIVSTALAADPSFALPLTIPPEPPADSLEHEQGDAKPFIGVPETPITNQATVSSTSRADSPEVVFCGASKTVRTKLCHPVRFDHVDSTHDKSDPCHFCDREAYGIIGLEPLTIQVVEWDDGRGWEEVGGGHRSEGTKATQVCPDCTMSRMKIMVCEGHALRRIQGVDVEKQDLLKSMDRLVEKNARETWCSVCCDLAIWECCLEQQVEEGEGCGLTLCGSCEADMKRYDGSFEAMLQHLEEDDREIGLRADYELLKQDGLLMGYLRYSAEE